MPNTILDKIKAKYPDATGISDARNIAEAVACVNGTGGRGANAIADKIDTTQETEEELVPGE